MGQPLKVEHIETGLADEATRVVLSQGRVPRPVPREAHSQHRAHRQGVQAAERRGGVLEGRRVARAAAAACTRPRSSTRRSWPTTSRSSRRRSGATIACWASSSSCSRSARRSARGSSCGCRRGRSFGRRSRTTSRTSCGGAGTTRSTRRTSGEIELYQISGHFPYYSDCQFPPIDLSEREGQKAGEGERYLLKPMNCPHHIMIYKAKPRSVPRPAGAAGGVRHRLPLRADRAS